MKHYCTCSGCEGLDIEEETKRIDYMINYHKTTVIFSLIARFVAIAVFIGLFTFIWLEVFK